MGVRSIAGGSRAPVVKVFTSNATYNATAGAKWCEVEMVGGGGGVVALNAPSGGVAISAGAASGSYIKLQCLPSEIDGQPVVVGQNPTGNSGTASSIGGTLIVAPGGSAPGTVSVSSASLPAGTVVNAAPTNPPSAATFTVGQVISLVSGQGASNVIVYLSAANAASGICVGSAGGSTPLGIGGWAANDYPPFARNPANGTGYGSGCGSSVCSNNASTQARSGQPGVVIIREYF